MAQNRTIKGRVTSAEEGESLPGVNVVVDLSIVTITGINGEYSIEVPAEAQYLKFSYVGFENQTIWARRAWDGGPRDWFVFNGSYISLREVMLSYRFQPSLLDKSPFQGITLSLVGRNLVYLQNHLADYGVSPEAPPNTDGEVQGLE